MADTASIEFAYGERKLAVAVPEANLLGVYSPRNAPAPDDASRLLRTALQNPIGTARLREIAHAGQRVAIVISDLTRPCPSAHLLPPVLDELAAAGVANGDVTIIIALGLHRPMTDVEIEAAVGADVARRVRVLNHDPADTVRLGATSAGTPVELFRPLVTADLRVCLGNLEFHYFAGYSGGAKAILPGCASRATINANHAMMVHSDARAGRIDGNPVRRDIEEGVAMVGVDFILNVVVDEDHRITAAVAGGVTAAHRAGCELIRQRGALPIPRRADVVLAGAGGWPKDVNLYQAQKALENASYAVQPGGTIVLLAECREGFGSSVFETWMREAESPDAVLTRIQHGFIIGGHKAAAIAAVLKRARVRLISSLVDDSLSRLGIQLSGDASGAVAAALADAGEGAVVLALPDAGSSLPLVID
jgi:nickel-dependent lactate racemase